MTVIVDIMPRPRSNPRRAPRRDAGLCGRTTPWSPCWLMTGSMRSSSASPPRCSVCGEHGSRLVPRNRLRRSTGRAAGRRRHGVKVVADAGLASLRRAGTIIVPGWQDIDAAPPEALLEALRRAHARGARIASICAGVFVVAAAGLLDGRRVAVALDACGGACAKISLLSVDPSVLYVDDGDIMSSAGRAAGWSRLDECTSFGAISGLRSPTAWRVAW